MGLSSARDAMDAAAHNSKQSVCSRVCSIYYVPACVNVTPYGETKEEQEPKKARVGNECGAALRVRVCALSRLSELLVSGVRHKQPLCGVIAVSGRRMALRGSYEDRRIPAVVTVALIRNNQRRS